MLTTEAMICEIPETKQAPAGGPGGRPELWMEETASRHLAVRYDVLTNILTSTR